MDRLTRATAVIIGVGFALAAFKRDLRMRRGLHGPSLETHTVTPLGRILIFLIGALSVFVGLTGITEFWHFSK